MIPEKIFEFDRARLEGRRERIVMTKIARPYDYHDVRDPSDTFNRFERPDYEPRDKSGRSAERGKPFTWAEIEYFEFRQGITMCPTPTQPEPELPGLTKMQEAWALTFDPLAGLDEAMATCREHIELIKATSGRDRDKASRTRNTIKGILLGITFADVAAEMCLDRAFLSRTMADAYKKWPRLERPLKFINLLNDQARRKCGQLSTQWQFALRMGEQIIDDDVLIWGSWPGSGPRNHVPDPDHVVKLAELQHKAFPPIRSNYGTMLARYLDEAPSRGSQRIERVYYDKWGYETKRTDGSVRVGAFKDRDRLHDSIDAWQRLREFLGLSPTCRWLACHGVLFDMFGHEFFLAEARRRKANRPECPSGLPASFLDAPWINPGYLIPTGAVTSLRYKPPYVPFVNEHGDDKLKKGAGKTNTRRGVPILCGGVGPWRPGEDVVGHWWSPQPQTFKISKYRARLKRFKGKKLRTKRWASAVHNASNYGPDANTRYNKIFGHLAPPKGGGEVKVWGMTNWTLKPGDAFDVNMITTAPHCHVNAKAAEALGIQQKQIAYNALLERPIELWGTIVEAGPYERVRRKATRCMPINTSLSSLPPLTRHFQFPLLPWEREYAEFFSTPGLRPGRPDPDAPSRHQDCAVLFERRVTTQSHLETTNE